MERDTNSTLRTDERAVAPVIGFILLFAIGIIAFSSYQAFVVPNQNAEVEFSHSQQIENEFSDFRSNVVNAIESTDERSTSFTLGTQYPSRLIALNPPAAAGTLSTTEPGEVSLDSEAVGIGDVCGVNDATSRSLVYEPQYNEYQSAQSTVYENTFVGTTFRDGQSFPQPQRMIREDGVYLTLLTGSVSESRTGAIGVNINATERYHHEDEIDGLTIPSQFDSETWESQILADNEKVQRVDPAGDGRVEIILDEPLDVSCAVIGLNSDPEFTPPQTEPEPGEPGVSGNASVFETRWMNEAGSAPVDEIINIEPGETITLTVEVRGRDSTNPIEGKLIEQNDLDIAGDTGAFAAFDFPGDQQTDGDGQVQVSIEAADSNSANDGDRFEAYVTAGDDSDVVTIEIEEPEPADPTFDTLEAEAGGGNIQNVDVTFEISEEADVEIEITPGDTDRFPNITPNQEQTENVDVTGNTNPVDVAVSLFDSDTGEQIVRCEGTLDGNNDFLTIDPGPGDSEFNCE